MNHPHLRNQLLHDFVSERYAAQAVREIVGVREVHPDRLKDSNGVTLYEILCHLLRNQLKEISHHENNNIDKNDSNIY